MKKLILTESEKKAIILEREKAIVENFAKTFNKIKRIDENELDGNMNNIEKQAFDFANSPEMGNFVNQILSKANPQEIQQLQNVVGSVNEGGMYENDFSSFLDIANKAQSVLTENEVSDLETMVGKVMQTFGVVNIMSMGTLPTLVAMAIDHFGGPNFLKMAADATSMGSTGIGVLSVVASLIGGGLIWRIGKAISGEEVNGNTPLFEMGNSNHTERDIAENNDEVYNMFGHCIGRTEKPCKYTHSDLEYEILDNDFDMDIKLKRIGLKLTKSSEDADGFVEYKIWDTDVYNDMFN